MRLTSIEGVILGTSQLLRNSTGKERPNLVSVRVAFIFIESDQDDSCVE